MAKTYRGSGVAGSSGTQVANQQDLDNAVARAEQAVDDAEAAAAAASVSETNAASSESAAATSEANAATSESNAATSETNAAASESAASTSESNAAASESAAATSETNAAASEAAADADAIATAADAVSTAADAVSTDADATATAADAVSTAADAASTASDATDTGNDAIATAADAVDTAADAVSTAADAAATEAAWDEFDDIYLGSKASDPTLDNDGDALQSGALYWNSTNDAMRVYTGSAWQDVGTSTANVTQYTATAGQTSFSGLDDDGTSLSYTVGYVMVYLNGLLLDPDDYTATTGTSIVLDTGAAAGDTLQTLGFGTFDVSTSYTKTESDAQYQLLNGSAEEATTTGTSVEFTSIPSWVKQIQVVFRSVGLDGTTDGLRIVIGGAGGYDVTNYFSSSLSFIPSSSASAASTSTADFVLRCSDGGIAGVITLARVDETNKWASSGVLQYYAGAVWRQVIANGRCDMTEALTKVKVEVDGTTDDFDTGAIGIIYS